MKTNKGLRAHRGHTLDYAFCPDIIVNDLIIVELKSVETFPVLPFP